MKGIKRDQATNIFEFFPSTKIRKNVVQLVKHYDEVPESKKEFPLMGQVKKDGVYAAVCVVGNTATIFGRTGKRLSNVELQEQDFFQVVFEGTLPEIPQGVFIAELCHPTCSLEVLSGITNPNRTKPLSEEQKEIAKDMYLCFHDYITVLEFVMGESQVPYVQREARLLKYIPKKDVIASYVMYDDKDVQDFANMCISAGEEGAVFKNPKCGWVAGHKGFHAMKLVRGVHYDLLCIGWEEGTGKYKGKVANLLFKYRDGVTIKCMLGKGWTHEKAREMYLDIQNDAVTFGGIDATPLGKIFHVYALQESSKNGKLRLPKVGELRHDKLTADF